MRGIGVLYVGFALCAAGVDAQSQRVRNNRLYVELNGNAGDASINYERLVAPRTLLRFGYGSMSEIFGECVYYAGFGATCTGDRRAKLYTVMVNRLNRLSVESRHALEAGAGFLGGTVKETEGSSVEGGPVRRAEGTVRALTATLGYRFEHRAFLARVGFTPTYGLSSGDVTYPRAGFRAEGGTSIGVRF